MPRKRWRAQPSMICRRSHVLPTVPVWRASNSGLGGEILMARLAARTRGSSAVVLAHSHYLHGVRAAGLADGLPDSDHDEIALLHHVVPHQDIFGLRQQLLAVVANVF